MDGDRELTPEAKRAIFTYMLRFAIPSGVALTIVSGICGYVVSGLARIDASAEAAKIAMKAMQDSVEAKANAATAAADAKTAQARTEAAAAKADEAFKYVVSVKDQVDRVLTGQYEGLAKSLFAIKEFRDSLQTIPQKEISEFNAKFVEIEKVLYGGGDAMVPGPGNICPPGTFGVSIGAVSVSGGAHGYLESVSIRCKPLRFDRPK